MLGLYMQTDKKPERYLKWANAFVVVYSIVDRDSFDEASRYLGIIGKYQRLSGNDGPVALVGNKADLERYRYSKRIFISHDLLPFILYII